METMFQLMDDDVVRTNVSQNWVTAPLCTEELFLRTQFIALSTYCIRQIKMRGVGKETDSQQALGSVPAGFTPPCWPFMQHNRFTMYKIIITIILWLGKTNKTKFSVPGDTQTTRIYCGIWRMLLRSGDLCGFRYLRMLNREEII